MHMNYSQIMSPRPPLPRKVGGVSWPLQLLWERRPCVLGLYTSIRMSSLGFSVNVDISSHSKLRNIENLMQTLVAMLFFLNVSAIGPYTLSYLLTHPCSRCSWLLGSAFVSRYSSVIVTDNIIWWLYSVTSKFCYVKFLLRYRTVDLDLWLLDLFDFLTS